MTGIRLSGAVFALLLALALPVVAQNQNSAELEALQNRAGQAFVAQDHATVRELVRQMEPMIDRGLRTEGRNGVAQYGILGEILFGIGDREDALRAYTKSVEAARIEGLWLQRDGLYVRYEYGSLLQLLGQHEKALSISSELLQDLEQLGFTNSAAGLDTGILVGAILLDTNQLDGARQMFENMVGIAREHDTEGRKLQVALNGLANTLNAMEAYEAALEPTREASELGKRLNAVDSESHLYARLRYGIALERVGRLDEARSITEDVLASAQRKLPEGHEVIQWARRTLEDIERAEGRKFTAIELNRQVAEDALSSEDPVLRLDALLVLAGHDLANLEFESYEAKMMAALELIVSDSVAIPERQKAQVYFAVADHLVNFRQNFKTAKPLYARSIDILTRELGPDHRETLQVQARRLQAKDKEIQANVVLDRPKEELAFWDGTEAGKAPTASDLEMLRRLADAEEAQGTRLEAYASQLNYAFFLQEAGQIETALAVIRNQIEKREGEQRTGSIPDLDINYRLVDAHGTALLKGGQFSAAAAVFQNGTVDLLNYLRGFQWLEGIAGGAKVYLIGQVYGELFASSALKAAETGSEQEKNRYVQMAFEAMQLAGYGPASVAVARAAIRDKAQNPDLVQLAAQWQNATLAQRVGNDVQNSDLDRLRSRMSAQFSEYFEWQIPAPLTMSHIQREVIAPDEAVIMILTATTQSAHKKGIKGLVLAVTRDGAAMVELPQKWNLLVQDILDLQRTLDPKSPEQMAQLRAPLANVQGASGAAATRYAAPFAFDAAERLHKTFFGSPEIADLIGSKSTWTLVPYGETLSIPFAALIVDDPGRHLQDRRTVRDLREIRWLGHERALRVVPSVAALENLRKRPRVPEQPASRLAYVGFGDPAFQGAELAALPQTDVVMRGSISQRATAVRALPRLPGTRREVETLAGLFGETRSDIRLGSSASEAEIVALNNQGKLAQAQILHFATHGLLSGAFEGLAEPALALTPDATAPAQGSFTGDGLLTASEAAQLDIGADWVILSACDTAGEDSIGGEGLGGLVQGFFSAGARNMLVSHWRVDDRAAEALITRTVTASQNQISKAESLRLAMKALFDDTSRDQTQLPNSHPSIWAPFLMIGAG